jgi:hypothetical protein
MRKDAVLQCARQIANRLYADWRSITLAISALSADWSAVGQTARDLAALPAFGATS